LSPELADVYNVTDGFQCDKMIITGDMLLNRDIKYPEYTYRINRNDFETLDEIIRSVNPQALFTKAMLETGKYFCVRKNAELLSVAGVHCYSKEAGVAVVGNVLAMPEHRGNGYASSVTASLCRDMWPEVRYMGLNVDSDNIAAVKMFTNMGFVFHSNYEEIEIKKK
jgi:predicted GNAT family acetyltransferase